MLISTKGRYALRVMIDLADHYNGKFIPMKEVAARQEISLKYLERILPALTKENLVEAVHGKGGGYRLTREPDQYTVWEILMAAEGDLAPVECLMKDAKPCEQSSGCRTLGLWSEYYELTKNFFEKKHLSDLLITEDVLNFVI